MIPKSFSASALQVAELCLARYKAEHINRAANYQGTAANVGIVCHGTLERFVKEYAILKSIGWDEDIYFKYFNEEYDKVFGPDRSKPEYQDAHSLVYDWFHRIGQQDKIDSVKVISVEAKNNFPMKTSAGEIPTNYIMDRLDRVSPTEYRVIDYKSQRIPFTAEQMRKKIQARLYALAVQIKFPEAKTIWVEFDFLRHRPVAVEFNRDDNIEFYKMLKRAVKRVIDTPDDSPPETLNAECGWCVRKASCKALLSNSAVGGVAGKTLDELAILYNVIRSRQDAQKKLAEEVERLLLGHAIEQDVLEFETDNTMVTLTAPARRQPDHDAIRQILGPELAGANGTFRVGDIDRLIKEKRVDDETARKLKAAMPAVPGELGIKVEITL